MKLKLTAKSLVEHLPYSIGRRLVRIPFSWRLGAEYSHTQRTIAQFEALTPRERDAWMLERLQAVVAYAHENVPFYRDLYVRNGFHPDRLKTLSHFQDVPIVTKAMMREYVLEARSTKAAGRMQINTGGTSGEPLEFYIDGSAFAREWAHMHHIWNAAGYRQHHIKLTLRGRNLGSDVLRYNAVHNEFIVNAYAQQKAIADAIAQLLKRVRVQWLHGYPSLIAELAGWLEVNRPDLASKLSSQLRGVLLGSEFPAPHYRAVIDRVMSKNIVAWYGHSEMNILARETKENCYEPLSTYGYCEAVDDGTDQRRLVGTSYWNLASPFIRYDTGDRIAVNDDACPVRAFSIRQGRIGEFVIDGGQKRIALTALIFGRHHEAFEKLAHVQVRQSAPGQIELLMVPRNPDVTIDELANSFDFTGTWFDVTYTLIDQPIRTEAGKVSLLVQDRRP